MGDDKATEVFYIGIDVKTVHAKKLINALRRLKWCIAVSDGGQYSWDRQYSQVWLKSNKTEEQVEDWLYNTKHGADYVGAFELQNNENAKEILDA